MLFVFDWDGTLADSVSRIVHAMRMAIDELGLPSHEDDAIREIVGLALPEALRALYPDHGSELLAALQERYSAHFVAGDSAGCEFFPGALDMLDRLRADGWQLAVATSKSRRGLDRALRLSGLEGFFHATRCADETRSKPHPLMLQELLVELRVMPEAAVMVGDTEFDMAMAQQAGLHRIGVSYGAHAPERLRPYRPALIIDELSVLCEWQLP